MDTNIINWIHANLHGSNIINQIVKWITYLGDMGIIWLTLAFILLLFKKTRRAGVMLVIGVGATLIFNSLIFKNIFNRPRPFVDNDGLVSFIKSLGMELPDDSSFPSGHSFVSFCSAIILTLQLRKKWPFIYILSSAIALSRVFLCVHYPTDVLAGAVIGTIVGVALYFVCNFVFNKLEELIQKKRAQKKLNANAKSSKNALDSNEEETEEAENFEDN